MATLKTIKENPPSSYLTKLAVVESGNNPNAKAKTSSASGAFQFLESTWKGLNDKYKLGYTLNDRFDPVKSKKVADLLTKENENALKPVLGRELNDGERYLGHFLGTQGSKELLSTYLKNPNEKVGNVVSGGALKANKSIFLNKDGSQKTVRDVYNWASKKMNIKPIYTDSKITYKEQPQETVTPTLNYFGISKETPTFASVPESVEEETTEKIDKEVAEVGQKTKEYNFLEELQKQDYSHLQPEQVAQQQIVPQVDFNQQFEQVSQFIDQPLAQQGGSWQEKLANRTKKPTIAEIIAEGDARKTQQRVQADNTSVQKPKNNKKEFENIILDDIELAKTMEIKNPRAEANKLEKFLPNKETIDFFKKVKDEAGVDYFTALLKIQSERGNPKINVGTDKGLPFSARRNYNPFTNEVNIPKGLQPEDDIVNYIQEVSHAGQPLTEVAGKFLANDIPSYIKARLSEGNYLDNVKKYVYDNPNNVEFYTHNILQPKLMEQVENFSAFDYQNMENKQQGGKYSESELAFLSEIAIKDNNGYWDKNNQGKVLEIEGNKITMNGVDQDLIGIGIDKKGKKTEQKTMKAGKNYNFDKAVKVIEIPFFKK